MTAWDSIKARLRGLPMLVGRQMRTSGRGLQWIVPGSQVDYVREAGDLRRNSVIAIALTWITRQTLQAPFEVGYETTDGEWQAVPGHPMTELLRRCNATWPGRQTWGGVIGDFLIYGNAYLYKSRGVGGLPVELAWLPAEQVEMEGSDDPTKPVKTYKFTAPSRPTQDFAPGDVIHFRDTPDPSNPIVGMGRLQIQVRNVASINSGERYTASVLRNGTAGKVVSPKVSVEAIQKGELLDETGMEAVAKAIRSGNGRENVGGVRAVTQPVELLDLGVGPEGMLIDRILDRPESMLLAALGLNPMALDLSSSAETRTYANKAEARREAWEHCIIPLQDAFAEDLTNQLAGEFEPGLNVWFNRDDVAALKEDATERVQRATQAFSNTLTTRNESREMAGLDPLETPDGELFYGTATADAVAQQQVQMEQQAQMDAAATPTPDEVPA